MPRKGEGQHREDEGRPGKTEVVIAAFEERSNKLYTADLKANRENSEGVVVHQEVPDE
jgi:hypothetical protein